MVTPLHLGSLHPVEQALTLALAFGPFAVLGVVVALRRRHERGEEPTQEPTEEPTQEPLGDERA